MASQVPYNPAPEVSSQLAPTPFGRSVPPPGTFGGLTAAATEHLGSAMSQAGNELFERANAIQQLSQQAAADEAASHFQMQSAVKLNELLSRQGKDAADALIPTINEIDQMRQDSRGGLSPYGQMQYDRDTRRMQGQLMFDAGRHAAIEQKSYFSGGIKAKVDTANQVALGRPMNDNAYQQGLDEIDKSAKNLADLHGWNSKETENWAAQQKSTLTANRIQGIARTGDPFVAERMLDQAAGKTIIGQDITNTAGKIYFQQNTAGARIVANRILSGEGSVAGGNPLPMSIAVPSIAQYMSTDNYDLISRAQDGTGQALGRYGVPAEKLSAWLKEANMPDMVAGDFLKSHSAQDQLFQTRFGKLQDDTGSFNDALLKWIGREPSKLVGSGTAEQRQAFGFLKTRGWSDDAAHAMVATLSGESGAHLSPEANQKAGGRNWESRFEVSDPSNGIANWDNQRSSTLESWAKAQGLNPNDRLTQLKFVDYEARQMGIDPSEKGDPRELTIKYTGSTASGQGYEKPLVNNGGDRWARYSGQRYAQDPVIQQVNGLVARNTPLEDLIETGKRTAKDLAPNNPLFVEYLTDRVQGEYRRQLFEREQTEKQNRYTIEAALNGDEKGHLPTNIDDLRKDPAVAQAFDHSLEPDKARYLKTLSKNMLAGGVRFTIETMQQYTELKNAAVNPAATPQERQKLLDTDISGLDIPSKERYELFKLQQQVYKQEEASPQMTKALNVLGPVFGDALPKKADTDNYNSFHSQLHDALQQYNRDFAKPINDDEIKEIGRRLLLSQPPPWSQRHLPEWLLPEPTRQYQLPLDPKLVDIARDDPRWAKVGIDPTDDMIRTWVVQEQFRQLYEKKQATR